ncbi:MAG TPA: polysaccharide deacetylase family protein, partial [Terrimicrobiaceae bacterium]|nr:polysaccharide deacetylase family protein [Terrimicrobiaceae bacterium]
MRFLSAVLSLSLLLAGCKKPAPEPVVPEVAEATPAPTPEPTPEPTPTPIDLNAQVIVFCYHRFEDKPKDSLAIKPEEFEAQMQAIKDAGIEVISMQDFLAWRRGEKSIPAKSAIISIDDGYISGYSIAWPILKKFGYPFTMFIYTDYVKGGAKSGGQSMTWEQLAEMRDAGVDIQSHTVSHSALNARKGKTDEQYREWLLGELAGSKQALEDKLGIQVTSLAYPYGLHNETVRGVAKEAGYEAAFTVYGQRVGHGADATMIGRYAIESTKPQVFQQAIAFTGPVGGSAGAAAVMPAAATMVTQPMD